jgi:exonuclease III
MSVLSLNCRGLGGAATVRELRDLLKRHNPIILCVVETQLHKKNVENLSSSLGFDKCFAVSSAGRSGGLGLFWNKEIKIEVLPYSQYHLDTIVTEEGQEPWRLTLVYAQVYTFG